MWWKMHGICAPDLQKIAIRILSQTCSSSGCERNWSTFDQIHTKRRNRLAQKKLNDLVFVHYNLRLREKQLKRTRLDPISLDNIYLQTPMDEWVMQEGVLDGDEVKP
jgi:hypothetical protein